MDFHQRFVDAGLRTRVLEAGRGRLLVLLHGAGHWPQWERPDAFAALYREFLLAD